MGQGGNVKGPTSRKGREKWGTQISDQVSSY
jgi:hypothetical protein